MRVWLDDTRKPPEFDLISGKSLKWDFVADNADQAIGILSTGQVTYMSFDHDLGYGLTGYDVAKFAENLARQGKIPRFIWAVHSSNPAGAKNIKLALMSAERYWKINESQFRHNPIEEGQVPISPGETPIQSGMVRRFHVTSEDNIQSIIKYGIQMRHAKGIEGPRGIYGWSNFEDAKNYGGTSQGMIIVEYVISLADADWHQMVVQHDIPLNQIIAIHEPWHIHYRYAIENGLSSSDLRGIGPEYDIAADYLEG
jgi:hypothetical protein